MGLRICHACLRRYKDHRTRCPYCGARSQAADAPGGKRGAASPRKSGGWAGKALALVAVLVAVNVWQSKNRAEGPDPQIEALHSQEEALQRCGVAIDSALVAHAPSGADLVAEYLQGGEYRITGDVEVLDGRRRVRRDVVCELQFRPEGGWTVEHIELASG